MLTGERADASRRRANGVKDPEVRTVYLDMAARLRRIAAQQEGIDEVLGSLRKAREVGCDEA